MIYAVAAFLITSVNAKCMWFGEGDAGMCIPDFYKAFVDTDVNLKCTAVTDETTCLDTEVGDAKCVFDTNSVPPCMTPAYQKFMEDYGAEMVECALKDTGDTCTGDCSVINGVCALTQLQTDVNDCAVSKTKEACEPEAPKATTEKPTVEGETSTPTASPTVEGQTMQPTASSAAALSVTLVALIGAFAL